MINDESRPLISVITVCYNAVSTIEETIISVINQNYDNIEYIIIDGGSKDGTVDLIKKYADKISYWISEPDRGIYDAMNKGIQHLSGNWGHFLNSGDIYTSDNSLMQIVDCYRASNRSADVIYGDLICKYDFGKLLLKPSSLEHFNSYFPISHPSTLVKAVLLKKVLFDTNLRIAADFKQLRQLYYENCRFIYFPISLVEFDAVSGISSTSHILHYLEVMKIIGKKRNIQTEIHLLIMKTANSLRWKLLRFVPVAIERAYRKNRLLSNKRFSLIP